MPHLISDAHEWINEIPTVPTYDLAKVTTHLPNVLALKMDGAQASHPYLALRVETKP